jgi:hypothetical protein
MCRDVYGSDEKRWWGKTAGTGTMMAVVYRRQCAVRLKPVGMSLMGGPRPVWEIFKFSKIAQTCKFKTDVFHCSKNTQGFQVAFQLDHQGIRSETLKWHEFLQASTQPCDVRTLWCERSHEGGGWPYHTRVSPSEPINHVHLDHNIRSCVNLDVVKLGLTSIH